MIAKLWEKSNLPPFEIFVFLTFLIFAWIWVSFGELRTKAVKVYIDEGGVTVSTYLGLGRKRVYSFSQFDGLETALLLSKYDTYEYLYLIENGKKVIKLSQFYHSNYDELKKGLSIKVPNLGQKRFSYIQEIKEIFT